MNALLLALFGIIQGARHALEPDHLAAVSTFVVEGRSTKSGAIFATFWGLGHAFMLLLAAGTLVLLRAEMPERVSAVFELLVGALLVVVGIRALRVASRSGRSGPVHAHRHGNVVHVHEGGPPHVHVFSWTLARRPLLIGLVHGLAGSGALAALAAAQAKSAASGVALIALYGIGATFGMVALAGFAGMGLARFARRGGTFRALLIASGLLSIGMGIIWAAPHASRLF